MDQIQAKMKTSLVFALVLIFCYLCKAQEHRDDDDILFPAVNRGEETAKTLWSSTAAEGGEQDLVKSDIWSELRHLRDMVVEQRVELRQLTLRVTAAESQVEALQRENTAMEARMTAAESLAEELQMENDIQATELSAAQQKLSTVQSSLMVSEERVEELTKQQEGQRAAVQELQNASRVRKVAFSTSLLASGQGNTFNEHYAPLVCRNVITNIGNHYNPITGYFIAPVKGMYYFRFTGHIAHTGDSLLLRLVKNGHPIVASGDRYTTSTDLEDNVSNGVVLQVEVGDVVWVESIGNVWDDQYHRTTFSGFLVFPL